MKNEERIEQTPELRKAVDELWGDWNVATGGNYADCDDAFAFVQQVAQSLLDARKVGDAALMACEGIRAQLQQAQAEAAGLREEVGELKSLLAEAVEYVAEAMTEGVVEREEGLTWLYAVQAHADPDSPTEPQVAQGLPVEEGGSER